MRSSRDQALFNLRIPTGDGTFLAGYSAEGLCELWFPDRSKPDAASTRPDDLPENIRSWHELTSAALLQALNGEPVTKMPPLDLSAGSRFQQSVWRGMLRIPMGQTSSYGRLAEEIGNPGSVRAVGQACGANPIPVLVPCHRILAAKQKLGGFSSGLPWKRKLLAREKVELGF